ncbi:MAG: VIT family protein [Alphaproteobacteria bacterium]|nr:VIT family protein [Alphaproteobacteria bacterium]
MPHAEHHYIHRSGWLRAAVLGANDGILSTASLIIGIAATAASTHYILLAGFASLVAGALSMAAGEYVSVSSQADTERADLATERQALAEEPHEELDELIGIYKARGLDPDLAREVAIQLTEHDALGAHARDELGISATLSARPVQAAFTSAISFALGAILPLVSAIFAPKGQVSFTVAVISLFSLAFLGAISARMGGAKVVRATSRVLFWGVAAMLVTWLVGRLIGVAI